MTRLARLDNAMTNESRKKQGVIQNELDTDRCPAMIAISEELNSRMCAIRTWLKYNV